MGDAGEGAAARAYFAGDRVAGGLGMELVSAGPGRAVVRMAVTAAMLNGHGTAHGGHLFLLADTAFACACNSHGPLTVAAGAAIEFLAPAREGDVLVAEAEERHRAGRGGLYDVRVRRGATVVAEFRGRARTPRPPTSTPDITS
ncbi:hydroxyphenylacetyl-CoA thioesterase PaaI [Streptomyces sp. NPDC050560]|uniref:hydroxyphenylacetyl-CoA thioesterase PaaI n=1 Tax=Streptomyces sp. NPDC050560 TaxID=3365630 RepID=UPI003793B91C